MNHQPLGCGVGGVLERFLEEYPSTVIAVTHDRYFLDNVAEWILELDRGHGIPGKATTPPGSNKGSATCAGRTSQDALAKTLKRELEWVRTNPKARQAKSKARLQRYEELASQEFQKRNRNQRNLHTARRSTRRPGHRMQRSPQGIRRSIIDRELKLQPARRWIVGIIGPNGAGKTTLFRIWPEWTHPAAAKYGSDPRSSLPMSINPAKRSRQEHGMAGDFRRARSHQGGQLRNVLSRLCRTLQLQGHAQQQFIGDLSGGERNRVHLAKVPESGGNVLLLDEPTNDLDIETLRPWKRRWWRSQAARWSYLTIDGSSTASRRTFLAFRRRFAGGVVRGQLQEYVEDHKRRKGEDASQPHRIRYKPLTG